MKLIGVTDGKKIIASMSHHDYISLGKIMHDGGQPGTHCYAGYNRSSSEQIYFEVPQTFAELYTDYRLNLDKKDRSYGIWNIENVQVLNSQDFDDVSSFTYKVKQAIWGTRGVDGTDPLKYVHLVDCSTKHLEAILDINTIGESYRNIINFILKNR